jgi:GPH family glycoside/pentoside/hexuronide:cation symporter
MTWLVASAAKLPIVTKLAYGLGQAAEGMKNYAFELFLFFYFTQVLGLRGTQAGLALLIALLFDAVTDPLTGSWSDNLKHRFGRRHPFMYLSALPLAVTFYLLFTPPEGLGEWGLFAWLTFFSVLVRGSMTLYHVPHLALGAELSSDYHEKTSIVGYRVMFAVIGSITMVVVAFNFFFVKTDDLAHGQLNASAYPGFALTFAVLMLVTILVSALGTHNRIATLPKAPDNPKPLSLTRVYKELAEALRNPSFRYLFIGIVIFFVTRGVQKVLNLHMLTFFWGLDAAGVKNVQLAVVLCFAAGVPTWAFISKRIDKRPTLLIGIIWFSVLNTLPPVAELLGLWPSPESTWYVPCLQLFIGVAAFGGAGGFVAAGSMMADIADEHELTTGVRQEGIFFGALAFAGKSSSGLGNGIAGLATDLIGFPARAVPGSVAPEVLDRLAFLYGPGIMTLTFIAVPIIWRYRLDNKRHAEILEELARRRSETS